MISEAARLCSRPREYGTMQYVQNLLHPSMMGTKATYLEVRAVAGTSHLSSLARSPRSATRCSPSSAREIKSGSRSVARVPAISLTEGLLSKRVSPSSCATQPVTPKIGSPVRRDRRISPIRVKSLCAARSRTEQVLKMTTSALRADSVISKPACRRRSVARSLSATFI